MAAYYKVLGLDAPPEDRKAVKRAYSKKLKVTRPEDDPDGFMRLRDAHDLALSILARQAETAERDAQSITVKTSYSANIEPEPTPLKSAGLSYEDMLPTDPQPEPESATSYALGPTPNFDAPVTLPETVTLREPDAPEPLPLIENLNAILDDPKLYNDREKWNSLFRKARQLNIDGYVDFEHLLLERILDFHGYFDEQTDYYNLDKMGQKLSPSITASLFKTMSWDQFNTHGNHRAQQIEWLERRMRVRKRVTDPVPIPETNSLNTGKIWLFLLIAFVVARILITLAKT